VAANDISNKAVREYSDFVSKAKKIMQKEKNSSSYFAA
jgi:hypothetical protein